jgi:hypothetical protein
MDVGTNIPEERDEPHLWTHCADSGDSRWAEWVSVNEKLARRDHKDMWFLLSWPDSVLAKGIQGDQIWRMGN